VAPRAAGLGHQRSLIAAALVNDEGGCSRHAAILQAAEQNRCPILVAMNGREQCSQIRGWRPTILVFRSCRASAAAIFSRQESQVAHPSGPFSGRNVWHRTQLNATPAMLPDT
jgi:hypothetical protein